MRCWTLQLLLACLLSATTIVSSVDVQWTPNPEDETGPLPLSQKQRQQLTELTNVIQNSPNPQETLNQAAASNNMDPQDLLQLLQRNQSDGAMQRQQQHAGGGGPIRALLTTIGTLIVNLCRTHSRSVMLLTLLTVTSLYLSMIALPRTGILLSKSRGWTSRGPTTWGAPPVSYLQQRLDAMTSIINENDQALPDDTLFSLLEKWDESDDAELIWHKPIRHKFRRALTAVDAIQEHDQVAVRHAQSVLSNGPLTEFADTIRVERDGDRAVLVVPNYGDYGRYGLLDCALSVYETQGEDDDEKVPLSLHLILSTDSHFQGEVHIVVTRHEDEELNISVSLIATKRPPPKRFAERIVTELLHSVSTSIRTRTMQTLARSGQSEHYRQKAERFAKHRRSTRLDKEAAIEEMSADRRRRWQRNNPNAGSYRPSNRRQRSPNNAIY